MHKLRVGMNFMTLIRCFALIVSFEMIFISCDKAKIGLDNNSIIREGHGIDDFEIETLTVEVVKNSFGDNFELIDHKGYSIELFYKEFGTSFYFLTSEPTKIFAISFNKDFRGKTERGLSTDMLVRDMLKIYGQPRWNLLVSAETLYAHYDSLGIYFAIKPKDNAPLGMSSYSNDDSVKIAKIYSYYDSAYNSDKIIEISIGVPGTNF
jgi:hypothetical protein